MINALKEKIKGKGTRIVFTEGSDPRILEGQPWDAPGGCNAHGV